MFPLEKAAGNYLLTIFDMKLRFTLPLVILHDQAALVFTNKKPGIARFLRN
jgi:hypothetical protein